MTAMFARSKKSTCIKRINLQHKNEIVVKWWKISTDMVCYEMWTVCEFEVTGQNQHGVPQWGWGLFVVTESSPSHYGHILRALTAIFSCKF